MASINHDNGTIENTYVGGVMTNSFTCETSNAGPSPTFQWYYNNSPVGTNSNSYVNNSISTGDNIYCEVIPDYNNCSNSSVVSSEVELSLMNLINASVNINPMFIPAGCKKAITPVSWENEILVNVNGNSVTKSGATGWNSRATSTVGIDNDMALTTVIGQSNTYRMLGASNTSPNANYTTIDYAFYMVPGSNLYIFESGTYVFYAGSYSVNDTLSIKVESNTVKYFINGSLLYTSANTPTLPLYADCSLYSNGATFEQVNIEGYVQETFTCVGSGLGTSPSYQWLLNGQPVGTNSASYSNPNLVHNDLLSCSVTPSINNCGTAVVESGAVVIKEDASEDFIVHAFATPVSSGCLSAESSVVWTDIINATTSNGSISRSTGNSWGGSGSASINQVNDDMYMYTVASQNNTYRMIGLSSTNVNANYNTIQYAIYLSVGGGVRVYESGVNRGSFPAHAIGDTLKISVESGTVKYYKNSVNFYTSTVTPSLPLIVDVSIYSNNGELEKVTVGSLTQDTFTCSASTLGSNPTYQWYLNSVPVGSNSNIYVNGSLGLSDTVWCEVIPDISNCLTSTIASNKMIITSGNFNLTSWTGAISTDWFNASNWTNGEPSSVKSASIVSGLTNYPVISINASCQNLIIENGASLELTSNDTLFVNGAWSNSGTFTSNSGTISLSPNCGNNVFFENDLPISPYNVMIDNGAEVEILGAKVSLRGALSLENGSLNTNDSLRLVSDATETARITEIRNGSITGNVEVERYIDNGVTNWRCLTFSVSGQDLESFDDDFISSGFPGTDFPNFPNPVNPFVSFYSYDESVGTTYQDGFIVPGSTADPVQMGQGWWVWCGDSLQGTNPFTIDAVGPIYQGDLDLPVSYTASSGNANEDGWNLVANPYHCTIDWDSPDWDKTNINGAIFIWNPDLSQYASYVGGVGTNLGDNNIASSQAFWVHTNAAAPQLTIKESCKVNQDHGFIKKADQQLCLLRLKLSAASTLTTDETVIRLRDNATNSFDSNLDALKFFSTDLTSVQIASRLNSLDYAINSISEDSIVSIDLKILIPTTDSATLTATDLTAIENMSCVIVEDLVTGNTIDLKTDSIFTFYQSAFNHAPRLRLHFKKKTKVSVQSLSCFESEDGALSIDSSDVSSQNNVWLNNAGDTLSQLNSITNLSAGTFFLTYDNSNSICQSTIDSFAVSQPQPLILSTVVTQSSCENCCDGEIDLTVIGGTAPYQLLWDYPLISSNTNVTGLCEGEYRVQIQDENGCELISSFVIGNILNQTELVVSEFELYPNPTNGLVTIKGENIQVNELKCFNSIGQDVSELIKIHSSNNQTLELDMGILPSGVYIISMRNSIFRVSKL